MSHSEKLEDLLEGKPVVIIEDGELSWSKLNRANMTEFEFFMELRLNGVEQLGQVKLAILETNGQISVYFFADEDVKPGLSILPKHCTQRFKVVPETGDYACVRCSEVVQMSAGIINYVRAAQIQNGRRPVGQNGSPDSENIGFCPSIR